ncbi:helix-turn-helix domain-containing protein [Mucilaginibacter sabulilitoris]|uniref:Helix-turn-helix domain-containing protein n=1 Tax=Mucilaginibacter sabulilitoris TaxID=1173583 RepID=A0ABZ0TJI9_9SPHI|nr:helix-turn-helix domain-containing protein [Mucilaginibacter sabulilitoris]WPU91730.1 helix-turn-helix domain-containing protein [Mucilaginibacter sabulilitoris]
MSFETTKSTRKFVVMKDEVLISDHTKQKKKVVIVAMTGRMLMDFVGPSDVFTTTNIFLKDSGSNDEYEVQIAAPTADKKVTTGAGIKILCDTSAMDIKSSIDTLIICNYEFHESPVNLFQPFYTWLAKRTEKNTRRIGSVCAGTFALAKAGLINQHKVTTHWNLNEKLQRNYPQLHVDTNLFYAKDGHIYTSGGVSSGVDMALAMVEEDFGKELAIRVARELVVYRYRPGYQSQFGSLLSSYDSSGLSLKLRNWVKEHLHENMDVRRIADHLNMSTRNFTRVFHKQTGIPPAKFVEKVRVEEARKLLEDTDNSLENIAELCGLGGLSSMRRTFLRLLMTTPSDYRRAFRTSLSDTGIDDPYILESSNYSDAD